MVYYMAKWTQLYVVTHSLRYRTSVDRISKLEFASHNINRYAAASQVDLRRYLL